MHDGRDEDGDRGDIWDGTGDDDRTKVGDGDRDGDKDEDKDEDKDATSRAGPQCPTVEVMTTGRDNPATIPHLAKAALQGCSLGLAALVISTSSRTEQVAVAWQGAAAAWAHLSPLIFPLKRREDYNEVYFSHEPPPTVLCSEVNCK